MQKIHWKDYLSFSKKERTAIIILVTIIVIIIVLPWFIKPDFTPPLTDTETAKQMAALETHQSSGMPARSDSLSFPNESVPATLFYFDPNTIDAAGWEKLGLREKTIQTILNYRSKGGRFKSPADIHKIYGLKKADADRLEPFIKMEQASTYSQNNADEKKYAKPFKEFPKKTFTKININTATEEEWKSLPGIGDVLAKRIIKFRTAKKGFANIDDVKKTYGLKDSVFENIRPWLLLGE